MPSRVSTATRFQRWQTSVCPMRWMRPKRCSRRLGFQQVVVDHQVGALQVDALPGGIRGHQDADILVLLELFFNFAPLIPQQAAMDGDHSFFPAQQERILSVR